jgi:hypothetical protein
MTFVPAETLEQVLAVVFEHGQHGRETVGAARGDERTDGVRH